MNRPGEMDRILVAGASIAGLSAARELRRAGFEGTLQLIDRDPSPAYRRPAVSKGILTGSDDATAIQMPWPENLGLELLGGLELRHLDLADRKLIAEDPDGDEIHIPFDGLVLATGSDARSSPFATAVSGIHTLRSLDDATRLRQDLLRRGHLLIVGAGFIGLEVAASARSLGLSVTVIEAAPEPLAHVVGSRLAGRLAEIHRARGVEVLCGSTVAKIEGVERLERVVLSDGRKIDADAMLVAIGSAPAVEWLRDSGLDVGPHGVLCDQDNAVAGVDGIVAAGDIATWDNPLYGRPMRVEHWTNAIEGGSHAARRLLSGSSGDGFSSAPYFWSDQYGSKLQSIGSTAGHDEVRVVVDEEASMAVAYGLEGRLIAVAGVDVGALIPRSRRPIERGAPLESVAELV
jgi:NADPH-dependent 2,4-dienoyl-CoA reductase/sulfur reductase-like enzyme